MEVTNFDGLLYEITGEEPPHIRNGHFLMPKWPFRCAMVGTSGSGKTNLLANMIMKWLDFDRLYVFAKDTLEEKYQLLQKWAEEKVEVRDKEILKWKKSKEKDGPEPVPFTFLFSESLNNVPPVSQFDKDYKEVQTLMVFDDMITEKDQQVIEEYFVRGRKRNVSCIYISQSFFHIPKLIRQNLSCAILFEIPDQRTLKEIATRLGSKFDKDTISQRYNEAMDTACNSSERPFLFIDDAAPNKVLAIRCCFHKMWL